MDQSSIYLFYNVICFFVKRILVDLKIVACLSEVEIKERHFVYLFQLNSVVKEFFKHLIVSLINLYVK